MTNLQEIRNVVFHLPVEQRAELARELLASLDDERPDTDCLEKWGQEAIARSDSYHRGETKAHDLEESLKRTRRAFEEGRM